MLGNTRRLMPLPSTADLSFPRSVRSRSVNGSDYWIVTSSVCGAQHPERLWGGGLGDISAVQKDTLTESCISQAAFTPHWGSLSLIDVKALQH